MPSHMMTNKPVNANDEDLIDGMAVVGKPIDQPTSMSYCLQRIRLGELCREITDSAPFGSDPGTPNYEVTKYIDGKICEFADSLPSFFSLSYNSGQPSMSDNLRPTTIITQRYILNFKLNSQRCKLHLPYLSHALKNPAFEYSRNACLEAARMVILTEQQMSQEKTPFALARLKSSGMLHCICVAIIVLLIEHCGRGHQQEREEGRAEIFEAFAILEEAKEQSPFAGRLLESFRAILRQHSASTSLEEDQLTQSDQASTEPALTSGSTAPTITPMDPSENTNHFPMDPTISSLDDLWQVFDENVDTSTVGWTSLFAEFDSPFQPMY